MSAIRTDKDKTYLAGGRPGLRLMGDTVESADALKKASRLGIVAGLRSMTPLAALAWTSESTPPVLRNVTAFLAVGEIIGDKLPLTPSRIKSGPFMGRIALGALSGALLCKRLQQPLLPGAIRGGLGAVIGTLAGATYRSIVPEATGLPDFICALAEDGVAVSLAFAAATPDTQE
ncbi:hypothetical protein KDA_10480 [Dictyobacter alpinus]|uniref:DUF4126 domain-containing protein n=1 Tax=Dictyobacter alpinus TaxID=2014873 RepID=A0A402B2H9_9CHLR|nr:hypothetical protein [Dictyobacter alpinus]GCE25564.1 hypothetical protein KDA_10480 [Dictyobacter alpinus]